MTSSPDPALHTLRKRNEFILMRSGARQHSTSFVLQMRDRKSQRLSNPNINAPGINAPGINAAGINTNGDDHIRVGYTVTKKIGNAVERNRIKRRMREAARLMLPGEGRPAHDYVLIGKRAALNKKFEAIVAELGSSLKRVHRHSTKTGIQNGN